MSPAEIERFLLNHAAGEPWRKAYKPKRPVAADTEIVEAIRQAVSAGVDTRVAMYRHITAQTPLAQSTFARILRDGVDLYWTWQWTESKRSAKQYRLIRNYYETN